MKGNTNKYKSDTMVRQIVPFHSMFLSLRSLLLTQNMKRLEPEN